MPMHQWDGFLQSIAYGFYLMRIEDMDKDAAKHNSMTNTKTLDLLFLMTNIVYPQYDVREH